MGRKKIQISRITDERNRQVNLLIDRSLLCCSILFIEHFVFDSISTLNSVTLGHVHETKIWSDEKSIRTKCSMRL